jgi:hypothetical protein
LEKIRPMLIAEFAKLVELVKKYAAPMYAPTAAGAALVRRVRARRCRCRRSCSLCRHVLCTVTIG